MLENISDSSKSLNFEKVIYEYYLMQVILKNVVLNHKRKST